LGEKLHALPGVQAASLASQNSIPLHEGGWDMRFLIEGRPEPPPHLQPSLQFHLIAPITSRLWAFRFSKGVIFTEQDNREHLRGTSSGNDWGAGLNSIIIDEEFARALLAQPESTRPAGPDSFWRTRETTDVTIVGVVGRIKENRLSEQGG